MNFEEAKEKEMTFLFYKTMTCPICDQNLKWRTIKSGKLKVLDTQDDMRPLYYGVDANKYHVICCPNCGFSSLERNFVKMSPVFQKRIKETICANFTPTEGDPEYISYRDAFKRYHSAISSTVAKGGKASEVAYLFLKTAWLLRGEQEELKELGHSEQAEQLVSLEEKFIKNAYDGFAKARMEEGYPMCGMDEVTVDYLVASLANKVGDYDVATKMLSSVITSYSATSRMKDKARELKDVVMEKKGSLE